MRLDKQPLLQLLLLCCGALALEVLAPPATAALDDGPKFNVQLLTTVHPDDRIYGAHRRMYAKTETGALHPRDEANGGWEYYEPNPAGGAPLGRVTVQ